MTKGRTELRFAYIPFLLILSSVPLLQSSSSVWLGNSPALQFLLKCGLVPEKRNGLSTDDIYSKQQLEKGLKKLQILVDLPVTGVVDEDVMKIVNAGSCPLKGKKPQKQQLKVLSQEAELGCVCNGVLDYRGNGQCRSIFHGRRWCYVQWNSKCQDRRRIGGVLWSWEACER